MKEISFTLSQTAEATHNAIAGVASGVSGEAATAKGRLSGVVGSVAQAKSPLCDAAQNVDTLRTGHTRFLSGGGHFVCIHPYLHPIGDRRGEYSYLTPRAALAALADKIADPRDIIAPANEARDMVAVLVCGADHAAFSQQLAAFCEVFPITGFELAKRRSASLSALEEEKFVQTTGKQHPQFVSSIPRRYSALKTLDTRMGALLSVVEGVDAENIAPEAELSALLDRKAAKIAEQETAWQEFKQTFTGGNGHGLYTSGSLSALRKALTNCTTPSEAYKLTAVACWVGKKEKVAIFKEVFGL